MPTSGENFGLTVADTNGADNWDVWANANWSRLDACVQLNVISRTLAAPPISTPADGDRYLVASTGSGAWSGQTGKIAVYRGGSWTFYTPKEGWLMTSTADAGKLYKYQSGAFTHINASGSGTLPWFNVDDAGYGVDGNGTTDDQTAIQAILDAVPSSGGLVMFGPKTYLVGAGIKPKSNTVIMGQGYATVIKCPDAGWTLASPSNMGIINVYNVDNIRITNLRVRGTKVQTDINLSPKLIFAHTVDNLTVDHCWLENTHHEGFWPGSVITDYTIANNVIFDVGFTNTYGGLPAIQLNGRYATVANNRLQTVGIGIQGSNADQAIVGNEIRDVGRYGIGTGDGSPGGAGSITGNTVEVSEGSSVRYGFYIDGTASGGSYDDWAQAITGNVVRITGTGSGSIVTGFFSANPRNANFTGNVVDITYRGQGFLFAPTVTTYASRVTAANNVVRVKSESAKCVGFVSSVNGASTNLQIHSKGNTVYGLTRATHSSYGYDYSPNSGTPGTLGVFMQGDWTEEGYVRVSTTLTNSNGEYDKTPIYWTSNNFPSISLRNHLQLAELASAPSTPASGNMAWYPKNDGRPYIKNDAGVELCLIATSLTIAASDESTALTTGTAKVTFRMPYAMTLTAVRASLTTAQTSGSLVTVDINEGGTTVLSTKLTIDNGEKTSTTAAAAPVISDAALADDAEITIDIDQIGDGTAKGLKVTLIGVRA